MRGVDKVSKMTKRRNKRDDDAPRGVDRFDGQLESFLVTAVGLRREFDDGVAVAGVSQVSCNLSLMEARLKLRERTNRGILR